MEGKKKYFALIIFLFLGLMIFTFANPAEEEKEFKGGDKEQSETVTNKRQDTTEEDDEDEQDQQQVQQNLVTNNNQGNAQGGNQGNNPGQTPVVPEDTTLRDALAAVEKAEGTYTQDDVDAAKDLVNNVTDTTEKGKLEERLEEVEAGINALALLENLEKQVEEANKKADMNDATDYRNENEIANKIEALNNETVKEELSKRLEEVSKLLDDNAAPTTKIEAKVYADNVEITAEDEAGNPFKMYLAKGNGKEKEISSGDKTTSDGVYTLRLVDEAFNEQTVTFTVDTTAPALKDLTSGAHYPEITLNTEDLTKVTIEVTNMDKNETTEVEDGTKLTEDATYKVILTDEAGNAATYWLAIDTTKPTVSIDDKEVEEKTYINENKEVKVFDKFLTNVSITHEDTKGNKTTEEFTRVDFEVGARNENFTLTYELTKAGTYTVAATDKYGNTTTKTIIVDKVLSIDKLAIIGANGQWKDKEYIQYAKTGTTVYVNARFKEELASTPVVKLNETIELTKATKKEDNGIWIYSYSYKLKDNDGLVDGTIQVKVTNIKDFAGNTAELTNEHMTMESQSEVVVDRTLPTFRFTKAGSSLAKDEITPLVKDGVYYFNQHVRVTLSDSVNLRLHGIDTYYDDKNANRTEWLKDVKEDGLHTAIAKDAAGNKLEFQFVVDTKGPEVVSSYETLTVEGDKTAKFKDFPIFTVTDLSGAVEEKLVSGNVDMSKVGEYELTYEFTDFVGNKTTKIVKVNVVDTTAPVVTTKQENDIVLEAGVDKYKELGAVVTDNIDDTYTLDKPSYINHYTLDGTFTGRVENVDTTTLGKYLLVYTATDANGNKSNNQLAQSKKWVIVQDTINPTITIKKESIGTSPYYSAISFALSDSNKVDYAEVNGNKFDVTNAKYSDANYQNIKGYLAEGTNIIKLYDTAGNVTEQEFVIDWTAPVVNVKEYIGQNPYSGASFKLSDNNQIDYFELNGKKYDRTNAKYSDANYDNIKASLKNGQNKLVLYDAAGNSTTYEFELERVAPTITVSNGTIGSGPYRKLNLKMHDASGIASVVINGTKLPHTGTYVDINDGHAYTFQQGTNTVTVMDKAGNTVTKTFEVDRNTIYITNMTELKEAFANGGRGILLNDIEVTETLVLTNNKELTLDMNGKKLTINDTTDPMMDIKSGNKLTITGNGTFDLEDHKYASLMYPRGEVIIENGTFLRAAGTNKNEYGSFFVGISSSSGSAKLTIYDGYFDGGYYVEGDEFNNSRTMINGSWGQKIKVYGGTFVGQNPAYGDEGMAYTNPAHAGKPADSTYCQTIFFEGQNRLDTEIPSTYTITEGKLADGRPTFKVTYTPAQ